MEKIGCLCLRGFTRSPFEVEPLVEYLRLQTDWTFSVPVLTGHGENDDLSKVSYRDWIEHAESALKELMFKCNEVYVIGFSMGGIIACYLAANYPVKKLVLLSAAVKYINPKQLLLDIKSLIKDLIKGNVTNNELYLRYKNKIIKTPIRATQQFRALVSANSTSYEEIKIPVFIAQGNKDGIVPVNSAYLLYEMIPASSKNLYIEEEAEHLICHCQNNQKLFKEIELFLKKSVS